MAGGRNAMYICLQPEKSVKVDSAKYFELITISYLIIEKTIKRCHAQRVGFVSLKTFLLTFKRLIDKYPFDILHCVPGKYFYGCELIVLQRKKYL